MRFGFAGFTVRVKLNVCSPSVLEIEIFALRIAHLMRHLLVEHLEGTTNKLQVRTEARPWPLRRSLRSRVQFREVHPQIGGPGEMANRPGLIRIEHMAVQDWGRVISVENRVVDGHDVCIAVFPKCAGDVQLDGLDVTSRFWQIVEAGGKVIGIWQPIRPASERQSRLYVGPCISRRPPAVPD